MTNNGQAGVKGQIFIFFPPPLFSSNNRKAQFIRMPFEVTLCHVVELDTHLYVEWRSESIRRVRSIAFGGVYFCSLVQVSRQ